MNAENYDLAYTCTRKRNRGSTTPVVSLATPFRMFTGLAKMVSLSRFYSINPACMG